MNSTKRTGVFNFAACVSFVALAAACTTTRQEQPATACKDQGHKLVKLEVDLDEGLRPIGIKDDNGSDASIVRVCPGDYVRWKAKKTDFELVFNVEAPFDWSDRKRGATFVGKEKPDRGNKQRDEWQVIDVVRDDATKGVELKYSVVTPAGHLDPMIIIEP